MLVSMGRFSVYCCRKDSALFWHDQGVYKGYGTMWSCLFYSKLNSGMDGIDASQDILPMCCFLDNKGIIYISYPQSWGVVGCSIQILKPVNSMALPFAIDNLVAFHLPHYFIFLFNNPEQNRTFTTLVPSTVLISC